MTFSTTDTGLSCVVTKSNGVVTFGNDGVSVVTKPTAGVSFDNYAMFIRVRRRKLKGGSPQVRRNPQYYGPRPTESASFDVVRAVRVDGKPRQKFLCGLGSIKQGLNDHDALRFWVSALCRMTRADFDAQCRRKIVLLAHAKGAPLPPLANCLAELAYRETRPTTFQMSVRVLREFVELLKERGGVP
jgi:hypothetical protein